MFGPSSATAVVFAEFALACLKDYFEVAVLVASGTVDIADMDMDLDTSHKPPYFISSSRDVLSMLNSSLVTKLLKSI